MSEVGLDYARPVTRITAEPGRNSPVPSMPEIRSGKGMANMSRFERRVEVDYGLSPSVGSISR